MPSIAEDKRRTGVLLHISSLPSQYSIGDFGSGAYQFVDWLAKAGCTLWQTLPFGPTGYGNSPYACISAFAGNHLFISPEQLYKSGLLKKKDLPNKSSANRIQYSDAIQSNEVFLRAAFQHWKTAPKRLDDNSAEFFHNQSHWLHQYAVFQVLRQQHNHAAWTSWSERFRKYDEKTILALVKTFQDEIQFHYFVQWIFSRQWNELRQYCLKKNIALMGDIPIFMAHDSVDVWANRRYFRLDDSGSPTCVAGVPPDYFSKTGQLWGNPHYRWDTHSAEHFQWHKLLLARLFSLFDIVRIDHFRGFEAVWEIPYPSTTAEFGRWTKTPGKELFAALQSHFGPLPLVAEDLGVITEAVTTLRKHCDFPGMKVLQFGYDSIDAANDFLPHNFTPDSVVYTGTHDNDTTEGWYRECSSAARSFLKRYRTTNNREAFSASKEFIVQAISSTAKYAVIPMQDVLSQGSEFRMNIPGTSGDNWGYRIRKNDLRKNAAAFLYSLNKKYNRL